jgi:glc operon protein GlcG
MPAPFALIIAALWCSPPSHAFPEPADVPGAMTVAAGSSSTAPAITITLAGARRVLDAAVAAARTRGVGGAFAVVDAGGHLVAMDRLDGTFAAAAQVSIDKARTAAVFRKPTRFFEEVIRAGRTSMVALEDFTPLQGGVPIVVDEAVVGAIGVSGASSAAEDDELAVIGAAAVPGASGSAPPIPTRAPEVDYLGSGVVREAFASGAPLVENESFKVHASRRESGGLAEVHSRETDVFYVLQGSATFVTGGTLVEPHESAANEIRGRSIRNGETRKLGAGDVVVVPAGVPHWFESVDAAPVLYFVVKVIK